MNNKKAFLAVGLVLVLVLSVFIQSALAKVNSLVALVSSLNPSQLGSMVNLTATVDKESGQGAGLPTPTGSINFMEGVKLLGTVTLDDSAVATLATSSLAVGAHSITAVYGGNGRYEGSTSTPLIQVVFSLRCFRADVNGDGAINTGDYDFVRNNIGCNVASGAANCVKSDASGNGIVNPSDFTYIRGCIQRY